MKIHCIRHGKSQHNVDFNNRGQVAYYDPKNTDPHLTELGVVQSCRMFNNWPDRGLMECIYVSPLSRTLETAECVFGKYPHAKVVVSDLLLEAPLGKHTPNFRKPKSFLQIMYPLYNFDGLLEYHNQYTHEETPTDLKDRIEQFRFMLHSEPYENVCLVGHSSFLQEFLGTSDKIEHCKPYLIDFQ